MRRFYLPPEAIQADQIRLTGAEARHISSVLRLQPGQAVEFFDGQGFVYGAVLALSTRDLVTAAITSRRQETVAVGSPLTVAQCLLKGKKMDLLVQKATELGVQTFLPVVSRYCENHGDRDHQGQRWQRIMIEACKQCRRTVPMVIAPVQSLDQVDFSAFPHRLAAWEEEMETGLPTTFVHQPGPICLLLGPEGGLHDDDRQQLGQWSFTSFSLGPRILRGETACLAAMAIVQYLTGTLKPVPAVPDLV